MLAPLVPREPRQTPVRPTFMSMVRTIAPATMLLATLAGCGTASEPAGADRTTEPDLALYDGCRADDPALDKAAVVAEADIDGDGTKNEIAHVAPDAGSPCGDALFTTFDGEPAATALPAGLGAVSVLQLVGTPRQLLAVRGEPHPRGGYELTVYGGADGRIDEVLADGRSLVGFVATDVGGPPATARCTEDGGVATVAATIHEPPGVVLAWDVRTTTYSLVGNRAVEESLDVDKAVPDPVLRKQMPEAFDPEAYFADCTVDEGAAG